VFDADAKPVDRGAAGLPARGIVGWDAALVVWGAALWLDSYVALNTDGINLALHGQVL
jgi:hypothetical protein